MMKIRIFRSFIMAVSKRSNRLSDRIPNSTVKEMGLEEGADVEIMIRHKPDVESLLARLRKFRGRIPADFRFDRDETHTRGAGA
jgi:antitoxin MazE